MKEDSEIKEDRLSSDTGTKVTTLSSLGFFCFIYPRLSSKEASNLEKPTGTDQKKLQQKAALLKKQERDGLARGRTLKQKLLYSS